MIKGMHAALLSLCLAGVAVDAAQAQGVGAVRKQVESSLLVRGEVDIARDGSVSALAIEHEDKLPAGVVTFVRGNAMQWKFEPVLRDGQAVLARAPMSLRVVAKKLDDGDYRIELRGVSFQRYNAKDPETLASIGMKPPSYPEQAYRAGVSGSVYLVLKIGRDGKVEDAMAEQVNLRVVGSESEMRRLRGLLARNALAAAGKWTFRIPSQGKAAQAPYWSIRVPVEYSLRQSPVGRADDAYGTWMSYVPGPREHAPWAGDGDAAGFSPDTLADGGVYMADGRSPRLLTPLQGG
jgi:hypothetical protein